MDEIDIKILEILMENARTPFVEIAKKLKVSEATIRKRVKSLEKRGVIKKYTIIVDPEKVGYRTIAIVGVDADPTNFLEVARKITELKEARYVATSTSTGDHMIMTEIWARDTKHLSQIIEKIGSINGVKKICPAIILEKLKEISKID